MTNYTTLVAARTTTDSIAHWLNHNVVPSTAILTEAEAWIYQRLRARQMGTNTTGTMTIGDETIALPTNYRQPRHFMFTGTSKHIPTRKELDYVLSQFAYDGTGARTRGLPRWWAVDATTIQFETEVDKAYVWRFDYYRAMAALGTATETNFLTEEYPTLLRATCLFKGYEFLRNTKEKAYWLAKAMSEVIEANVETDLEKSGETINVELEGFY